ncbi:INO80 complex subunit E [Frankliniella fusca]|uniref:INO80 complex subunit E n=1 Tax=Frankliniella fusca TaxID=407009 RepID=A0AAE1GUC7_9NEOP|nr:INO80 complex subunit E [Frankliniella fusca]
MSGKGRSQMMQGWYQQSIAQHARDNQDDDEDDDDDEEEDEVVSQNESVDYKEQYKRLKRKLKYLIYENECYQENLRNSRAKLLEIARDRSFLLDRLLQYEKVDISSSSESGEDTESSDGEVELPRPDVTKRRKVEASSHPQPQQIHPGSTSATQKNSAPSKKKKATIRVSKQNSSTASHGSLTIPSISPAASSLAPDGHMTPEEVERHLSARGQSFIGLLPEKAPPTVPTEMFSNEPSLDSESNDQGDLETSPSNMGEDCLSVDMLGD